MFSVHRALPSRLRLPLFPFCLHGTSQTGSWNLSSLSLPFFPGQQIGRSVSFSQLKTFPRQSSSTRGTNNRPGRERERGRTTQAAAQFLLPATARPRKDKTELRWSCLQRTHGTRRRRERGTCTLAPRARNHDHQIPSPDGTSSAIPTGKLGALGRWTPRWHHTLKSKRHQRVWGQNAWVVQSIWPIFVQTLGVSKENARVGILGSERFVRTPNSVNMMKDCETADNRGFCMRWTVRSRNASSRTVYVKFLLQGHNEEHLLNSVFERTSPKRKFLSPMCASGIRVCKTRGKVTSLWRSVFSVSWGLRCFVFCCCFHLELHM